MGMLGDTIGMRRAEAFWRVTIGSLWFVIATVLVAVVWVPLGLLLYGIDAVWQFIFNSEGIMPMNYHRQALGWYTDNLNWYLYGSGMFDPLPYL